MLVEKSGVNSAEEKSREFLRNVEFLRLRFILSRSGKIKVLARFFDVATFNFMVKTSLLLSERDWWRTGNHNDERGAERPAESIRHPDAGCCL